MPNKQRRPHLTQRGVFKSDKYDWCKPGFLALKFTDPLAQDLIEEYAYRRATIDLEFKEDVLTALTNRGYELEGDSSERGGIASFFLTGLVNIVHWRPSKSAA